MSDKTETHKPATGISLFDAFGPNVSEEVDAINQRAAELSMGDMVQVMGLQDSSSKQLKKVEFKGISSFVVNTKVLNDLVRQLEDKQVSAVFGLNDPAVLRGSTIPPTHSRDELVVKRTIESASDQLQKLLDAGVDSRSISIAIKYQEPDTGLTRTHTVEDDTSGSAGVQVGFRRRFHERKVRKTALDYFAGLHPVGSKK